MLLRLGYNPKIVAERLGHSSVALSLDVSSSVPPDLQRETAEELGGLFNSTGCD